MMPTGGRFPLTGLLGGRFFWPLSPPSPRRMAACPKSSRSSSSVGLGKGSEDSRPEGSRLVRAQEMEEATDETDETEFDLARLATTTGVVGGVVLVVGVEFLEADDNEGSTVTGGGGGRAGSAFAGVLMKPSSASSPSSWRCSPCSSPSSSADPESNHSSSPTSSNSDPSDLETAGRCSGVPGFGGGGTARGAAAIGEMRIRRGEEAETECGGDCFVGEVTEAVVLGH